MSLEIKKRFHDEQWTIRVVLSFLVFLIAHTAVVTFGTTYVLQDPDTYWHIRTGNWILENATVPYVDIFSYTAYGQPWIANDWFSDVLFAAAFNIAGWRGVVEFTALFIGAMNALICFYLMRILRFSVAIGLTAITGLLMSPHYLARPLIISYVIASIWIIVLLEKFDFAKAGSSRQPPLVLIPIMALWANIHGSFTIGLIFLYIFAAYALYRQLSERQLAIVRHTIFIVVVITAASFITPYGIYSALITPKALNMSFALNNITEWLPPNFQEKKVHLTYIIVLFSFLLAVGVKLKGPRLPAFILLFYLGLSYLRGLVLFILLTPFLLATPVADLVRYLRVQTADPVAKFVGRHGFSILAPCLVVAVTATALIWNLEKVYPPESVAPRAAIAFVKRAKVSGNVFNSYNFGGYLVFSGIPTAVDGRAQPFGDNFLRRYFNAINLVNIDDAHRLLDELNANWAILRPTDPISRLMAESKMWESAHVDEHAIVFLRVGGQAIGNE